MRAPKYIASLVWLLLSFVLFQSWMWHWRPEPGWHPSWWQSETLANVGFILSFPAMLPTSFLQDLGASGAVVGWSAIAFGFLLEIGMTYVLVYFPTRYLFRRHSWFKNRVPASRS